MDIANNIVGLFGTALQCFEYIQIARQFEDDYEVYQLKFDIASLRLSRWGEAAAISTAPNPAETQPDDGTASVTGSTLMIPEDRLGDAERCLFKITKLFKKAQAESEAMKPSSLEQLPPCDPDGDLPPGGRRLRVKLLAWAGKRRGQIRKNVNQIKWAFYKKDQLEAFIEKILELTKELEELFPPESKDKLEELSREEFNDIGENLNVLKDVVECDPYLGELVSKALQEEKASQKGVSLSARNNYGLQQGINYGDFKGVAFGTGYRITNKW